jgi:hypothetical protein
MNYIDRQQCPKANNKVKLPQIFQNAKYHYICMTSIHAKKYRKNPRIEVDDEGALNSSIIEKILEEKLT